ncbi:MAG: M15 family metallopeptidase [Rhizobiaceae bacterium]
MLTPALAGDLPEGFVRLGDVDRSIRQVMSYAGSLNFLGRPARGYEAPVCILSEQAANALAGVQKRLMAEGLSLVMFDCYRPQRAVSDFASWARQSGGTDPKWHPTVARNRLIRDGYIASRSAHSRGSTVDVGIAPVEPRIVEPPACGADSGTLDFGTGFDCLDPSSNTDSRAVSAEARANRRKLVAAMREAGFRNYSAEWWHFTLEGEPFRKPFDFLVTAR